jgi:TRAP-type C4-dicarboxylate transport system permease small subunit
MRALVHFINLVTFVCRIAIGIAFAVLIAAVALQVFTRTFNLGSPIWTEELSRFALLYMAALGIGLALRSGDLVNVDLLQEAVSPAKAWWMRLTSTIITAILAASMIGPAWRFTQIGAMQRSPSLRWSMDYVHASILVLSILLFVFATLRIIGMLAGTEDGRVSFAEEE